MKYFIKTFGCQMNESDSQRIASFLEKRGHKKSATIETASLIVVNACSVRQSAIDRIWGLKQKLTRLKLKNPNVKFILTGCVLKSDKRKFEEFFDEIVSIEEFSKKTLFSDCKKVVGIGKSGLVPIMTGCNNFCSYCVVPYTRGREISRPIKEVINKVKNLIKGGCEEITLLGQNVNSYQYNFAKLLQKINGLPGNFQIKFLTSHLKPSTRAKLGAGPVPHRNKVSGAGDFSWDELIETIASCKKVAKEIHLPIQSGDDVILKKMNRGYTVEQYKNLVKKIRKKIPDVKISTDVIVGFPGETKKQFKNTVKLFEEIKYDTAFINKYSPRTGTAAFKLKDNVSWNEKKRRWKILDKIANPLTKKKLIVILGPTATGKSGLAIKIAKKYNGEIISADSRQIYKGMNIGTGKITKKEMKGISHYCLDIATPKKQIAVAEYRKLAREAINKIINKGKIPIICGGTGFYIRAIVEGLNIPEVKPDWKLRKELEKKTAEELFKKLKKLDSHRAENIDCKNRRRLIRAIEIVLKTKKPIPQIQTNFQYNVLYLGIKKPLPELKKSINKRVDKMIKKRLEKEVKNLIKKYGWTQVLKNAIGYAEFSPYAKALEDKERIVNLIKVHSLQFAKRQMTWFKKHPDKGVNWIKSYSEAKKLIKKFLL